MNIVNRILILEDDMALSDGIAAAFREDGYSFTQCYTVGEARKCMGEETFDLLILDVNLPDGSGVILCEELRDRHVDTPVILMTVRDMETDIVYGLSAGADDYITKPFTLMVLRARVYALLRRAKGKVTDDSVYKNTDVCFDFRNMVFKKGEERVELSKTEQKLLYLLTSNPNQIVTRDTLIERLWDEGGEYVDENALSVTVKRLRDKLEDAPPKPVHIKTVYGLGYKWKEL